jgi:hypothetical protein
MQKENVITKEIFVTERTGMLFRSSFSEGRKMESWHWYNQHLTKFWVTMHSATIFFIEKLHWL